MHFVAMNDFSLQIFRPLDIMRIKIRKAMIFC